MVRLIASVLKKREVLYGEKTPLPLLVEYGQAYLAHDDLAVALDFFEQCARRERTAGRPVTLAREGLERLLKLAVAEGDAFHLQRLARALPELVTPQDWEELIRNARGRGKLTLAERAERILHPEVIEAAPAQAPGTESVQ